MIGSQDRWREDLFVVCPLRDLISDDHILKQVDRVLDLSRLGEQVGGLYSHRTRKCRVEDPTYLAERPGRTPRASTTSRPRRGPPGWVKINHQVVNDPH